MSKAKMPGSSYYRKPELVECLPILCFCCNQPMVRFDQNRYKVLLSCIQCLITIQMKTNEVILYKGELDALNDADAINDKVNINTIN